MEFEILNEIMTSTVAQLFTINRSSHLKFFKNSSQLNESKIDIPMGRGSTSNLNNPLNESQLVANAADWVSSQGRKFLDDAKDRLFIDTKTYQYKDQPLNALSVEDLGRVKRAVKNELKKYDQTFVHLFFRQPAKTDKEPLRPLYMYYKKLKTLISNYQKNQARGVVSNEQKQGVQAQNLGNARATSQTSNQSKLSFTTAGGSSVGSRDNSLTNQSPFNSQQNNSLTMQDLNPNQPKNQGVQPQAKGQIQQQQKQVLQSNTNKLNERKNFAGGNQTNGQNLLNQFEKDPNNRMMGVRGSVELKSINSVGGIGMNMGTVCNGPASTQANSSGFAWAQSSKNHPQSSKAQSSKQQHLDQNLTGQQFSKNDMINVRKSAQAGNIGSLLDNQQNMEGGYGNQMMYQKQMQKQTPQQQQQQKNGPVQEPSTGTVNARHHSASNSQTSINFYPMYQQQMQTMGNEQIKENTNPFNLDEQKTQGIKKDKRPQSANQSQSNTIVSQKQKEQQTLIVKIEDLKKERAHLRTKLDSFRKQFEQTYNRKIKFKKDIKEVEGEFKRYKDLKDDINKLEKQLAKIQ